MPFRFEPLQIPDVVEIIPEVYHDERGFFLETYDQAAFREAEIDVDFVLDFYSLSESDVVRGLHFQRPPAEQAKLVYCSEGAVFDVAVDIRHDSESFGEHVSVRLDVTDRRMIYIPPGFAHGFAVVDGPAVVHYKASDTYAPDLEGGIRWDDPNVGIDWPVSDPTVSDRDASLPRLDDLSFDKEFEVEPR